MQGTNSFSTVYRLISSLEIDVLILFFRPKHLCRKLKLSAHPPNCCLRGPFFLYTYRPGVALTSGLWRYSLDGKGSLGWSNK